jgi:hypothetical protein
MATTITAGNATNGAAISSDGTGILELKTGTGSGTTGLTIDASQNVTLPNAITLTGGVAGDFKMNSGYGSVATAYGCRAWVNFNGTGTVAIRASGNVTSITDIGTGLYTVNFTTAMPNVNYAVNVLATNGNTIGTDDARCFVSAPVNSFTTGNIYLGIVNTANTAFIDANVINVAIFR